MRSSHSLVLKLGLPINPSYTLEVTLSFFPLTADKTKVRQSLRKVYRRLYTANRRVRKLYLSLQTLSRKYRSSQQLFEQLHRHRSSKACAHWEKCVDTGPDQMCVFNDLGLLAFRARSNKFHNVWAVDCFHWPVRSRVLPLPVVTFLPSP